MKRKRFCGRPTGHNFGHPLDRILTFFKGGLRYLFTYYKTYIIYEMRVKDYMYVLSCFLKCVGTLNPHELKSTDLVAEIGDYAFSRDFILKLQELIDAGMYKDGLNRPPIIMFLK